MAFGSLMQRLVPAARSQRQRGIALVVAFVALSGVVAVIFRKTRGRSPSGQTSTADLRAARTTCDRRRATLGTASVIRPD